MMMKKKKIFCELGEKDGKKHQAMQQSRAKKNGVRCCEKRAYPGWNAKILEKL
jgi:hypothetical protein